MSSNAGQEKEPETRIAPAHLSNWEKLTHHHKHAAIPDEDKTEQQRLEDEANDEDPAPWVVEGGAIGGAFGAGVGALVDVHNNRKLIDQLTATAEEHAAANQRQHTSDATMDLLSEPEKRK